MPSPSVFLAAVAHAASPSAHTARFKRLTSDRAVTSRVVSFDDDDIAVYLNPMLTTAATPFEEMGALAVRLLLDEERPQGEHLVHRPLRVRGSVPVPVDLTVADPAVEPNWAR